MSVTSLRMAAVGGLTAVLATTAMAQVPMTLRSDGIQFPDGSVQVTAATAGNRHFYLTNGNFSTTVAKTACADGYHMASMWEILDPSSLTYAFDHPVAHTQDDSGAGPPSYWYGWIRTGYDSSPTDLAGTGNCANWTSNSPSAYGVAVRLTRTWKDSASYDLGGVWEATSFTCNYTGPVWCVQDQVPDTTALLESLSRPSHTPEEPQDSTNAPPAD